jgi:hypothetical protein
MGGAGANREDIESMKIAYLTKKLDLTPDEAKKFWPVFNQFSEELKNVRSNRKKISIICLTKNSKKLLMEISLCASKN